MVHEHRKFCFFELINSGIDVSRVSLFTLSAQVIPLRALSNLFFIACWLMYVHSVGGARLFVFVNVSSYNNLTST